MKRPDFMRLLMSDFRTDQGVMRLLLQILLDPTADALAAQDSIDDRIGGEICSHANPEALN